MSDNFLPSTIRQIIDTNSYVNQTGDVLADSYYSTDSFFYDLHNSPLKSTQQLNVDWTSFQNHTFFMSAEVKVNLAFENIINKYPFDGTQKEVEKFLQDLTGFERWVFDNFPRYKGSLLFSGSYVSVVDSAGLQQPQLSKNDSGLSITNPGTGPLSLEMQLFLPNETNAGSIIFQKLSSFNQGISLHVLPSVSTTNADVQFVIVSGSNVLSASSTLQKGKYNHLCFTLERGTLDTISAFVNSQLVSSNNNSKIGKLDIDTTPLLFGSGTTLVTQSNGGIFTPTSTLSASLDEFRLFHSFRTPNLQTLYSQKSIFASPDLKLYYKFNEPPPLIGENSNSAINSIVLDSSGNGLHAYITNFTGSLRQAFDKETNDCLQLEKDLYAPILFPASPDVINFNNELLASASLFDQENPNLITKLVPPHYLLEGAYQDGFGKNIDGNAVNPNSGNGIPGTAVLGSQQVMLSFIYMWAKFFDEIKLYVDQFSNLNHVDYETNETIPDNFLSNFAKRSGVKLPSFFVDSTIEQYVKGENIEQTISTSDVSLKQLQNYLTRRILVSLPRIVASKGTQYSIKSFLRSVGIDPENSLKIREYGGPTKKSITQGREKRNEIGVMLDFSGSKSAYISSPFLSSSRIEPGYPNIAGTFIDSISNNPNDGLLTSGSWTFEATYKFPKDRPLATQNLFRLMSTGSAGNQELLLSSLVATPHVEYLTGSYLTFFVRPSTSVTAPVLQLSLNLTGSGIFDGNKWTIAVGRVRNDEIGSEVSSSYFIKAASQNDGYINTLYQTSSFLMETLGGGNNLLNEINSNYNTSGSYFIIGNKAIDTSVSLFLNSSTYSGAQVPNFDGLISNVRFWSKSTSEEEFLEHSRNYKSTGVDLPTLNYNFVNKLSGSFEKLRLDSVQKQSTTTASGTVGYIDLFDFSQNNFNMSGSNFLTGSNVLKPEIFQRSYLTPYFDEASTSEKVRIRGAENYSKVKINQQWVKPAPIYYISRSDEVTDDVRFSIDFSLVDALNKDIINIFSTLDLLNNTLGDPNLQFSSDYPGIERIRDVYFNRLSEKMNFSKFFEFFRWFDVSISDFIDQLIPKKTLFKGANFVIEPHMLERAKHEYYYSENYRLRNQPVEPGKSIDWLIDTPVKKF